MLHSVSKLQTSFAMKATVLSRKNDPEETEQNLSLYHIMSPLMTDEEASGCQLAYQRLAMDANVCACMHVKEPLLFFHKPGGWSPVACSLQHRNVTCL